MLPKNILMQIPGYGQITNEEFRKHCSSNSDIDAFADIMNDNSLYEMITDRFVEDLQRAHIDPGKTIGHCEMTKEPDGSIHARIFFE